MTGFYYLLLEVLPKSLPILTSKGVGGEDGVSSSWDDCCGLGICFPILMDMRLLLWHFLCGLFREGSRISM